MSTLCDKDIITYMKNGQLIINGTDSLVGPACYELQMSETYYDLTENNSRIDATQDGYILIKPGHHVVLITKENLNIPNNMIARVASKGSLFSIGLSPVSTYADPGFKGNLGIVTQNLSDKYIKIPIGEPIAKIDFSILSDSAEKPYSGQHGFQTSIWPIKTHLQKTYDEIKGDRRVNSEEVEAYRLLPHHTAATLKTIIKKQRRIDYAMIVAVCTNSGVLCYVAKKPSEFILGIAVNIVSTLIVGAFVWLSKEKA